MAPFDAMLTAYQRKVLHEDGCSDSKPRGLGYRSPSDDEGPSTVNMVVAEEDSSSGEEIEVETPPSKEEEVRPAPPEFEEGGQATVDELREVNLGTDEDPRPTFKSASLPEDEARRYIAFLKEYRDVFAWTYNEMPGLDPKVAVHKLAIRQAARKAASTTRSA